MREVIQQIDVQQRAAQVEAIDEATRTIRIRFSTGARRSYFDWESWRDIDEELSLQPGHVRLDRLQNGAPFLKDHWACVDKQIGVHEKAWLTANEAWATVKMFTDEDSEKCYQKIRAGAKNVSVGYRVYVYEITERDGQRPLYRAVDWEPLENSLVAINADAGAQVRSDSVPLPNGASSENPSDPNTTRLVRLAPCRILRSESSMNPEQKFIDAMRSIFGTSDLSRCESLVRNQHTISTTARAVTGKEDPSEVQGALEALKQARQRATELETENVSLRSEVTTLRSATLQQELDAVVSGGLSAGKLTPAQEAWARGLVVSETQQPDGTTKRSYNPEGLKQLRSYLSVAVAQGPGLATRETSPTTPATPPPNAPMVLTAEDRTVARTLGLTDEQMIQSKQNLRARSERQ